MTEGYVPWASVEYYLSRGQGTAYRLSPPSAHPEVSYVIEDGGREISLYVELDPRRTLPTSPLPLIRIDQIAERGIRMARVRVGRPELLRDFHDLLNAIAERIVKHEHTLDRAFRETVRAWSELLERPRVMHPERRVGLMGELMALVSIARTHDWHTAMGAWRGPDREEHDFGLPEWDLEVKTTVSERRRHTVHGLDQLTPTGTRPLWLLSIQMTRGGAEGRTLNDSVNAVRNIVANEAPAELERYDDRVSTGGWVDFPQDDERWRLRSTPLLLLVDEAVPRLDASAIPPEGLGRVSNVSYALDVTGLKASPDAPPALCEPSALHLP
ncbi:PD-(D/E)XK motif protein [Streptomyces tremellae]|uniref:PD-(D/E)XK motif protein n=1 Tax=Streptomyces tremellae TaxID=1124239 RepID=A0ABP7FFH8_9ACTN